MAARIRAHGVAAMMELISADLASLGVHHDVFTSERELIAAGRIDEALQALDGLGLLYTGTCRRPRAASRPKTGSRCRSSCSARPPMATTSTAR